MNQKKMSKGQYYIINKDLIINIKIDNDFKPFYDIFKKYNIEEKR